MAAHKTQYSGKHPAYPDPFSEAVGSLIVISLISKDNQLHFRDEKEYVCFVQNLYS
jgi:hypothetical protein